MLIVALTGGIGSGKSAAAEYLRECGAITVDSDQLARLVVEPGTPGLAALADRFGAEVIKAGNLDRAKMASIVFADAQARADLEGIIHPLIRAEFARFVTQQSADAIIVNEVPLLAEKQLQGGYQLVLAVTSSEANRRARLQSRGLVEAEIDARLKAQMSDSERVAYCDVILDNNGSPEDLRESVNQLWTTRLKPFEENLRLERSASRTGTVSIQASDPQWPVVAQRLISRLQAHVDAVRIEHIGSTSVPGLKAKNVIDLQVSVSDLSKVSATQFLQAGFVPHPITEDSPRPSAPQERWAKKFFVSADPMRAVNVHVREVGSHGERFAMTFRDWLRSDAQARLEYQDLKERTAKEHPVSSDYAEAKEPWFSQIEERMMQWAQGRPSAK